MTDPVSRRVPLCRPSISPEDIASVAEVLRSGWLTHGEHNRQFEEAFARYLRVPHAISVNSGASALEVAIAVSGIRGAVIVPSMTFVATANAIVNAGATPVFCDVDGPTRNVTADTIRPHISSRTEAVIVVHYGGQPCQMDAIVQLCGRHGLLLIEDSAETLGATWRGQQAGSFGIGCFSFFPTKSITTGEGGMLTCRDDVFAERCRTMIAHGIGRSTLAGERLGQPWRRAATMAGHNYRMPNPLAALGHQQLRRLDELNGRRNALAARYTQQFTPLAAFLQPPVTAPGATHAWQMYTIEVGDGRRDAMVEQLLRHGVGASVHFDPPVHLQPYYQEHCRATTPLPAAEHLARRLITLPLFPDLTEDDQDWVVNAVRQACGAS
jgi:perosamine synthetase